METLNWSEERMGRLAMLYGEGMSFSLIAADIGVSRNAAIGKAHRMHLPRRIEVGASVPRRARSASAPRVRPRKVIVIMEPKRSEDFKPEPGRDYRCTIYDLDNRTCRFPLWEAGTPHEARMYCGVPDAWFVIGAPCCRAYCRQHAVVSGGRQLS